jgi:hypothetical protein
MFYILCFINLGHIFFFEFMGFIFMRQGYFYVSYISFIFYGVYHYFFSVYIFVTI